MQTVIQGRVWKFGDKISTDLMMPGDAVLARQLSAEEGAKYCFHSNRQEWTSEVRPGDMIVAGNNFGCGSSRPGALMIKLNGISAVLAESTSRIFLRNAINYGLPTFWCKGVHSAFEEGDVAQVNIETGEVRNLTKDIVLQGDIWPKDSPPYQILLAGGLAPFLEKLLVERGVKPATPET